MITLTVPPTRLSQIGGTGTVDYEKALLSPININPLEQSISGQVVLQSTSATTAVDLRGTFNITISPPSLDVTFGSVDVVPIKMTLSGAQTTVVQGIIDDAQDALETGMINLGIFDGIQTTGV